MLHVKYNYLTCTLGKKNTHHFITSTLTLVFYKSTQDSYSEMTCVQTAIEPIIRHNQPQAIEMVDKVSKSEPRI